MINYHIETEKRGRMDIDSDVTYMEYLITDIFVPCYDFMAYSI